MATISQVLANFQSIKLREAVPGIVQQTEEELIKLNQEQLYLTGIDSEGKELKPYSFITELSKIDKGQPFDRTTLRDTGAFYRGFNISTSDTFISFSSTDSKTSELEEKYGTKIFGLTKENKTVYSFGAFYDGVKKHIQEKTGLSFM